MDNAITECNRAEYLFLIVTKEAGKVYFISTLYKVLFCPSLLYIVLGTVHLFFASICSLLGEQFCWYVFYIWLSPCWSFPLASLTYCNTRYDHGYFTLYGPSTGLYSNLLDEQGNLRGSIKLPRVLCRLILKVSRNGDYTTSLGNLFTLLMVKNFLLVSSQQFI